MLASASLAMAQSDAPVIPYNFGGGVRESEEVRRPPITPPPAVPVLPQVVEPQMIIKDKETVFVRSVVVEGPPLGAEAEAREALAPYENRALTLAEIYEAAAKITNIYRSRGYLVAKAYVPAQDARSGVLRIKLVPGLYGDITVKNASLVKDDYLQDVISHALGDMPLIHKDELERAMLLISDLPGAAMPRVAIGSGRRPETSDFNFNVPEARLIDGFVAVDNFGSPWTGRDRASAAINVNSPLGYGDRLALFGIVSDTTQLVNGRAAYSFPLGYDGVRAEIAAFQTTYVLGGIYANTQGTGTADALSASVTYAMRRQRDDSIYLSGYYAHMMLNDKLLGVSFANRTIDLGTASLSRDTVGVIGGMPVTTSTVLSFTAGYLNFPDPSQLASNLAGVDTAGNYAKVNLAFTAVIALNDKLSFSTYFRGQKSLSGNLDSSQQLSLTGYWGVRSYDEGLAGDSGYLVTPELKYALPDFYGYRHALGLFTDVGAAWLENGSYTVKQKSYTQLNDIGLGYYATYEYSPGRNFLVKAMVAHTYGADIGAQTYNTWTKGLFQVGMTF
ncbi:ShlB/FhaC/HecB family hemolysin secretion/activation protein [Methylocapsa polymorpha]|uniref:ShlB/FhaC/HecB family hemolysin secretion/activation protein n=1 Tax=Methylocapsa polymorpha TaxID=3080828 RepID=A0ABZ0HT21_9HYPH|nr:ShlB/FhaC/HecB family hemolysin secretion/activation protein [Methylocapsa sp. RX1]